VDLAGEICTQAHRHLRTVTRRMPIEFNKQRKARWPTNPSRPGLSACLIGEAKYNLERIIDMLYTIAVVLIILWLVGLVSSYTMGGFIHILLVIAIVSILVNIISGRRSG
jgi:hypothetical protein